jgi:vancomycin resistance protein YoaR
MKRSTRIAIVAAAAPLALVLWASAVFAMDRASNGGEILGGVSVAGVDLGGMSPDEARAQLRRLEEELCDNPIAVQVNGTRFEVTPAELGLDLDEEAIITAALENGRRGGITSQFGWWLGHFGNRGNEEIEAVGTFDRDAVKAFTDSWAQEAIDNPPFEGGISIQDGEIVAEYPRSGTGIDPEVAADLIEEIIFGLDRPVLELPTGLVTPQLTEEDVDIAVIQARQLVSAPVVLSRLNPDVQIEIGTNVLTSAIRSRSVGNPPEIELYFDLETLMAFLGPLREDIEFEPVDAQVVIRPDLTPTIIPGRNALIIDDAGLPDAVMAAVTSVTRAGVFPYLEGDEPELTTEDAEALGITKQLGEATTYHQPPNGDPRVDNRVHNIHLIADTLNGVIVMPGEEFSINDFVGQRTEAKGYERAPAIIGDEVYCCDHPANWGGGVSQFATTLYNAVFKAGLEDIEHTPHSLYISRYPKGREATMGWPDPDLVFRNNTENAVLIHTSYTDSSLTVIIFGDHDWEVSWETSYDYDFTEPGILYKPGYEAEPPIDVPPGEEVPDEDETGIPGFTVSVYRTVRHPDGTEEQQSWLWAYRPYPIIIYVHPCNLPEDDEDYQEVCPEQVPSVLGLTQAEAQDTLNDYGFIMALGDPVTVDDPYWDNVVYQQDPEGDEWLAPGGTVVVHLGVLAE